MLGAFVLAPRVSKRTLDALLGRDVGQFFIRDRAFFWWNCFALSDMSHLWDDFVRRRNAGHDIGAILRATLRLAGKKRWRLLSQRMGHQWLSPAKRNGDIAGRKYWTRGGTWDIRSNFTKLLVLKEHLPERPLDKPFMEKLGHYNIYLIEKELMEEIDPDTRLAPEARIYACDYVRRRVPEFLGWTGQKGRMGAKWLGWFFQCVVPYGGHTWRRNWRVRPGNIRRVDGGYLRWEW